MSLPRKAHQELLVQRIKQQYIYLQRHVFGANFYFFHFQFCFSIFKQFFPKTIQLEFYGNYFFQEHFTFHLFLQDSYVNTHWKRWQILMVLVCSISNYLQPPPIYFSFSCSGPFLKLQSDQISPFNGFSCKTWADFPSVVHSLQSSVHLSSHMPSLSSHLYLRH